MVRWRPACVNAKLVKSGSRSIIDYQRENGFASREWLDFVLLHGFVIPVTRARCRIFGVCGLVRGCPPPQTAPARIKGGSGELANKNLASLEARRDTRRVISGSDAEAGARTP